MSVESSSDFSPSSRVLRSVSFDSSCARLMYVSMSPTLRSSAASAFTRSSIFLRSCRVDCAFDWSSQNFGSLVLASSSTSCLRAFPASKKAPHELDTFLQLGEAVLEVFDVFSHGYPSERLRSSMLTPIYLVCDALDW